MTKAEKQHLIEEAIGDACGILLQAFVEIEAENDVQGVVMDPDTKKMYQLNFIEVKDPNKCTGNV